MAVANLTSLRTRMIAELIAAPNAGWTANVTGENGLFPTDNELNADLVAADARLCNDCIDALHPYANTFMTASANLANGANITAHVGENGKVEWSTDGITWLPSRKAMSRDDVINMVRLSAAYGGSTEIYGWHWIETNAIYHTSPQARVYYPTFTINAAALQMDAIYEDAILAGALASAVSKIGGYPEFAMYNANYFNNVRNEIRNKSYVIPPYQAFDAELAKAA